MVGCNTELVAWWRCPPIYWRAAAGADGATPPTRTTQYTLSQQPVTNQTLPQLSTLAQQVWLLR